MGIAICDEGSVAEARCRGTCQLDVLRLMHWWNLYPRLHRSTCHGLEEVGAIQTEGAGMILAFQLKDHVVPVQPAKRLASAPFDARHAEHRGLDHISLARHLVK